jgi:carbamoylphosphate synthase large subunit
MNERIRQLAKEAAREMNETGTYSEPKFQEKFAELIVRECMEQVFYTIEDQEQDNISSSIRDRIKEHFGVEE